MQLLTNAFLLSYFVVRVPLNLRIPSERVVYRNRLSAAGIENVCALKYIINASKAHPNFIAEKVAESKAFPLFMTFLGVGSILWAFIGRSDYPVDINRYVSCISIEVGKKEK